MSTTAKAQGGDYALVPVGMHQAVCYIVADIGTQDGMYGPKQQVIVVWEIPGERNQYEKDGANVDIPMIHTEWYSLTIHEKSNLGKHLISWRGKPFTAEEQDGFDVRKIAGINCFMNIIHEPKSDGKGIKETIASINPLPKTMEKLSAENTVITYNIDEDGINFPETLPDWIIVAVKKSPEYQALIGNVPTEEFPDEAANQDTGQDDDSDIPF